eukprot:3718175-Prymnesium_polylepis.1
MACARSRRCPALGGGAHPAVLTQPFPGLMCFPRLALALRIEADTFRGNYTEPLLVLFSASARWPRALPLNCVSSTVDPLGKNPQLRSPAVNRQSCLARLFREDDNAPRHFRARSMQAVDAAGRVAR